MNLDLNGEQRAFQDAVRKFFQTHSTSEHVRRFVDAGQPHDKDTWRTMAAELGLHGVAIPEAHGGAGAGLVELALVLEESGRTLLCSPVLSTVLLAATAIECSHDAHAAASWLPRIADGEIVATLAVTEDNDAYDLTSITTTATHTHTGWTLNGRKRFVIDGAIADMILVAARTPAGLSLFAVDAASSGLTKTPQPVLDPTRPLCTVTFNNVEATLIGRDGHAQAGLERTLHRATIGLAAEQLGVAQACLDMAVGYAKTRHQFRRPIGSFQAVKHLCADMFVDVEASRSLVYFAASQTANGADIEPLLAQMTGSYVSEAAYRAAARNLQIHGGIGYTWEHDSHLLFKRATSSAHILISPAKRHEAIADHLSLNTV